MAMRKDRRRRYQTAMEFADDLGQRFPEDTIVQFNYAPAIRAQLDKAFAKSLKREGSHVPA